VCTNIDNSMHVDWAAAPACPLEKEEHRRTLKHRESPYWHSLVQCRHIGIYTPHPGVSTWVARIMTASGRYVQHRLASAREGDADAISYGAALALAIAWFESEPVKKIARGPQALGRADGMNFCPWGSVYTVGAALSEYLEWSRIARSPGSHYNNIVLINFHLSGKVAFEALETFNAQHLRTIAQSILATHPLRSRTRSSGGDPSMDVLRRTKRLFNSIITVLRMAFRHAWDSGRISSDLPLRCLHRISVPPAARTLFLNRDECGKLIENCTPALARLVLAGLYTGCRVGELGNLRVGDVGREVYGLHVAAFKLSPARFVFLPDEAMAFFLSCCEGKAPHDHVLLSDRGKVWQRQHPNLFRRAVALAGLPSEFVFHGLRHTYASDLVRNGVPLSLVARQLGHADTRSVAATYGHLAEQFREDQIRRRFSPLSSYYLDEARRRAAKLETLWTAVHGEDWRSYGSGLEPATRQARSSARTPTEVLNAFGILR
jgi:integrase/recombinase XerD